MNPPFGRSLHHPTSCIAAALLSALPWSVPAICGPIHDAAKSGEVEKVRSLLQEDPSLVSSLDENGMTLLDCAAARKQIDVATLLIEKGADVNLTGHGKLTAIHFAALAGSLEIANVLLAHGADPKARAEDGTTPFELAAEMGHKEVAKLLLPYVAQDGSASPEEKEWDKALSLDTPEGYMDFYKRFPDTKRFIVRRGNLDAKPVMSVSDNGAGLTTDIHRSYVSLTFNGSELGSVTLEDAERWDLVSQQSVAGFPGASEIRGRGPFPNAAILVIADLRRIIAVDLR